MKKKQIAVFGSTGSIGKQTLQVIEANKDIYEAYTLTANKNWELLVEQARKFNPDNVVIADKALYGKVKEALADKPVKVYAGEDAIAQIAESTETDIAVIALVGFAGLRPTIHALQSGKTIALANKETLVVAGELVNRLVEKHKSPILPVDSEHSAIFQCIAGEGNNRIEKILLTASGGPFLHKSYEQLAKVTKDEALRHPNWKMGAKITIDSASMMNKGFEVIEAKWLFGVDLDKIEVVVHPQSIIHSMVQFADGTVKAQLGVPDMRIPIQYALSYPHRLQSDFERLDFFKCGSLTFEQPDMRRFRNLSFAFEASRKGGNMPCILNAANEVAVNAFLHDEIGFLQMSEVIETAMQTSPFIAAPTLEDFFDTDKETRLLTKELINKKN